MLREAEKELIIMSAQGAVNQVIPYHPNLIESLKRDEGFRKFPYRCPAGKLTIGYGFNLDDEGIDEDIADFWLIYKVKKFEAELAKNFPTYRVLDAARQDVLCNMAYNLGISRFMGFRQMLAAIERNDYVTAAKEMLNSSWAQQVGFRAQRLAHIMEFGGQG